MKVAIAGAGSVGTAIASDLHANGHEVLLFERDPEIVERLRPTLDVTWVAADACEVSSLDAAGLATVDVVVAATGDDEDNLVVSLLAKQEFAVPRVVARVNHPKNQWLFNESWGVDVSVSTPQLLTALVEEAVSVGSLVRLLQFHGGAAHLVEITLAEDSPANDMAIADLDFPRDGVVVAVVRARPSHRAPGRHDAAVGRRGARARDRRRRGQGARAVHRGRRRLTATGPQPRATGDGPVHSHTTVAVRPPPVTVAQGVGSAARTMKSMEAAFFDLDKTVIDRASIAAFGRPFMKGGLINRRLVARAAISQLIYLYFGADEERLVRVRESMLAVTKGWDRAQVRQIVRETMLQTIEPIMYAEALELMELHRAAGHRVYLVSASPEEIVLPLADLLGVDGAICSRGEVDEEGRYTGRMAFYAYGESKAAAMRDVWRRAPAWTSESSSAYSDSATDLPMLEVVGRPVAVNPDRALAKVARERGWEIRNFTKPIRLRDRVGRTTPVVTTSLAVAGAALILWRRGYRARHAAAGPGDGRQRSSGGAPRCGTGAQASQTARRRREATRGRDRSFFMDDSLGAARSARRARASRRAGSSAARHDDRWPSAGSEDQSSFRSHVRRRGRRRVRPRRSAGPGRRCPRRGDAASTWPGPRSGGCAHGSG